MLNIPVVKTNLSVSSSAAIGGGKIPNIGAKYRTEFFNPTNLSGSFTTTPTGGQHSLVGIDAMEVADRTGRAGAQRHHSAHDM